LRFIPIDINTDFTEAMRAVSYVLKKGKIVCIFPEGMRSIDGKVKEFKKGVGILIKELNIPAVPVYIHNSHRSWPRLSKFPRFYPIKVSFGKPFYPKDSALDYETLVKELRERVLELSLNKK
jgi:long-chain acyl-CoA synthetase